ncbi:hypothetical protein TVAG_454140 [Trichomonas vaginalis G3]|uniref:Uncharacterized protein n=1 Tax=Trichomonas vaginalis (strain ATCC PRA-98 / G3) TaxID=412133 RepID=A2DPZ0_TRIV3|nr:ribonuclease inhibitor domain-containing protein [Trichomonas vaginalis G3]EAY17586.1 hypothetical protein TVAG_454140 [Trichomonas vaginalis G3]KAI5520630.1 ribonuclease inhibitor domain-containing protein [Trichomonas vaginalis G3]|eukprot:XP_001329721.1 hypothetical protein [Trichomonas vaginalis G3]
MRKSDYITETETGEKTIPFDQHYSVTLKSRQFIKRIFLTLYFLCESALNKVDTIMHPQFRSQQIKLPPVNSPIFKGMLEKRAILFSHYSFPDGKNLEAAEYFATKWKDNQNFIISKGFHPAGYYRPFANALGYETKLKSVCFDDAHFKEFPDFVNILARTSLFISTIAFANYNSNFNLEFNLKDLNDINILNWSIINSDLKVLEHFVDSCVSQEFSPHRLCFGRSTLNKQNADKFFQTISKIKNLHAVKMFELNFVVPQFDILQNFIRTMTSLVDIEISHSSYDGGQLLYTICEVESNIMNINLTDCKFTDIPKFKLPKNICSFDFSNSHFHGSSLRDLIQNCVDSKSDSKFALRFKNIRISESDMSLLRTLKITGNDNLCEFDFSGNFIPKGAFTELIDFLDSQKSMRFLNLEGITSDAMSRVIPKIARYVKNSGVEALFINGRIAPREFSSLMMTLLEKNSLKRFHCTNSGAGNMTIKLLTEIVKVYPLEEIACDGMKPDKTTEDCISDLWFAIARSKTIKRCDTPKQDVPSITKKKNAEPWQPYVSYPYRINPSDQNFEILNRIRIACGMNLITTPPLKEVPDFNVQEIINEEEEKKEELKDEETTMNFIEGDELNQRNNNKPQKQDAISDGDLELENQYYSDFEEDEFLQANTRRRRSTAVSQKVSASESKSDISVKPTKHDEMPVFSPPASSSKKTDASPKNSSSTMSRPPLSKKEESSSSSLSDFDFAEILSKVGAKPGSTSDSSSDSSDKDTSTSSLDL